MRPLLLLLLSTACAAAPDAEPDLDERSLPTCVDGPTAVATAELQLLDVRPAAEFAAGHAPGAIAFDAGALVRELDGLTNQPVDPSVAATLLGTLGVDREAPLLVVGSGTETSSARVAWTLALFGHQDVGLLDGGFGVWPEAGGAVTSEPTPAVATAYPIAGIDETLRVDVDWVLAHLDAPDVVLIDVRTPDEYAAGHIPGALSIDWLTTVSGGAFRPAVELRALYAELPDDATVVVYCQSGMRAAVAWLGLRTLGFADVRLYDGSWSEWGARDDLPREP